MQTSLRRTLVASKTIQWFCAAGFAGPQTTSVEGFLYSLFFGQLRSSSFLRFAVQRATRVGRSMLLTLSLCDPLNENVSILLQTGGIVIPPPMYTALVAAQFVQGADVRVQRDIYAHTHTPWPLIS